MTLALNPRSISIFRHLDSWPKADVEIYTAAVRMRDEGVSLKEARTRIVRAYSPPFWPKEVEAVVREAYAGVGRA